MIGDKNRLIAFLNTQDDGALWDLAPYKEKRSLNQNSYYWKLCGLVAQKQSKNGVTAAMIHNQNLRDLGLLERIDGALIPTYLPDTDEAEKQALNAEKYHLKPTSQVKVDKDNNKVYRCYVLLRGSHTFNSAEMTALLNLMIQEAKALDIEVLPPAEIEHLRQLAEQAEKRKGKNDRT